MNIKKKIINAIGIGVFKWIIRNCDDGLIITRKTGVRQVIKVYSERAYRHVIRPAIYDRSNNGWIPVAEGLPKKIKFEEDTDCIKPVLVTNLSYHEKKPMCEALAIYCVDNQWRWFDETLDVELMDKCVVEIIAWQPLPEPWKG